MLEPVSKKVYVEYSLKDVVLDHVLHLEAAFSSSITGYCVHNFQLSSGFLDQGPAKAFQ
jgi:hypothetical protein